MNGGITPDFVAPGGRTATRRRSALLALTLILLIVSVVAAQRYGGRWRFRRRVPDRHEFPMWSNDPQFASDVFTFARIRYTPHYFRGWDGDYPEADWNISYRLQQLTTMEVNPNPVNLRLTDPQLAQYPFIFIIAPRSVVFSKEEAFALRLYLRRGGFLMVDECWGTEHWHHFRDQMRRVLPNCEPQELSLEHEIFHNVYDFREKPQAVAIHFWRQGYRYHPVPGIEADHEPHFFGMFDDRGRMMVLLCHNNDLVDGWEREGEDEEFFHVYSETQSYPMGINIITYAMTH